jgi:predicted Rossmann fold flavoprotein
MKVAIIGGGAAGLMAAAALRESNPDIGVILIERNNGLGKKVIISGGGRCNVTTGIQDVRTVLTKYPRGNKFLSSAMYAFPPEAVYAWFESHGVPLKVEEDMRVFPRSDDGKDIVGAFEKFFSSSGVETLLNASVVRVEKHDDQFQIFLKGRDVPVVADRLILTTGGQAYRHTGSTGDGYAFAQSLGHSMTPLAPSLNAFYARETWPKEISGLSFEQATISAPMQKKKFTGPFLFTHRGISGPAVFALSSFLAFETYGPDHPMTINVDLFPEESEDDLLMRLTDVIIENPKKSIANVLDILLPRSLVPVLCREASVASDRRANEVSKKDLMHLIGWLKRVPLSIIGRDAGDEFVTAGGIDLKEVDPSTMQSKICPGLYFAGEILDVDGFTGGFNLQASWATGRLAGENAAT